MTKVHFENVSIDISTILDQQNKNFLLSDYEKSVLKFIIDWVNQKNSWTITTSGSTGKPKSISLNRNLMKYSAYQTIHALKIQKQANSLLSINANFVGGKMMIVRSLENNMNIVVQNPSTKGLKPSNLKHPIHFAAFVPIQILSFLRDSQQRKALNNIDKVIIGGAPLPHEAINEIQGFNTHFWQTYGMTETYSHVALRQLNGINKTAYFKATGDILFSVDSSNRLQLKGTITNHEVLKTNDIIKLIDEKNFEWFGRYDNIINTGGIKVSPEDLENRLFSMHQQILGSHNFFISSLPDKNLGEKLVLYIEGEIDEYLLLNEMKISFSKYEIPKMIISKSEFVYTQTGKINREASINKN